MSDSIRLDRWLWFARFFKSRTLAANQVSSSRIRVNRAVTNKPSTSIRIDDVLTFPQGRAVRVIKVLALGTRRGPAPEAVLLYEDLAPPAPPAADKPPLPPTREPGRGRPTKAERRQIDRLRERD